MRQVLLLESAADRIGTDEEQDRQIAPALERPLLARSEFGTGPCVKDLRGPRPIGGCDNRLYNDTDSRDSITGVCPSILQSASVYFDLQIVSANPGRFEAIDCAA
jgi:hypothetical protein